MKYINLEGAFCCTKHCKAPTSGYAAVHSDGSQGREAWDKRYLRPRSPRPSRPLHAPPAGPRKVAMRPPPVPFGPALARRPGNSALDPPPPLYLARRSAAPRSPSRGPHRRLAAAGSIAPQAGRSHAALCGSDALAESRRAGPAALAARPPSIGAEDRGSRLGWLLILRTRRRDAQAQSGPGSSAGLVVISENPVGHLLFLPQNPQAPPTCGARPCRPMNSAQSPKRLAI